MAAAGLKQADLGLVADYQYFNIHKDESAMDLAEIVNSVDGIYQAEIAVTVRAKSIVVYETMNDPFSDTTTPLSLLQEMAAWKDANDNSSSQLFVISY